MADDIRKVDPASRRSPRRRSVAGRVMLALALIPAMGTLPATAQFFIFGGPSRPPAAVPPVPPGFPGGNRLEDFFGTRPPPSQRAAPADYSRAPAPKKQEVAPERTILVLGDAMADWLGYGLEDALAETPELGVVRKHKTISGLIRYQPKGAPADWAAAAKDLLTREKPSAIVVMLGLSDRMAMREAFAEKTDTTKPDAGKTRGDAGQAVAGMDGMSGMSGMSGEDAERGSDDDTPAIAAPERPAAVSSGMHEFRSAKWVELYTRKIEELIGILKGKGVPVIWVGLPAVFGQRATSDMLFLNALYRDAANRTGITYVDVWDGFVDEGGRFAASGPDFQGQTRRLRTADGVYFTKAGARKLAHFAEREIQRLLSAKATPMALPVEPTLQQAKPRPGGPAARPLVGPILPLTVSTVRSDELLGGAGVTPAAVDALAARTLVKGEPLTPPAGRADDFVWPRREVGTQAAPATPPTVNAAPAGSNAAGANAATPPATEPQSGNPPRNRRLPRATEAPGAAMGGPFVPVPDAFRPKPKRARSEAPRPPAFIGPGGLRLSPFVN